MRERGRLAALAVLAIASAAHAAEPPKPIYGLGWRTEVPILATAAGGLLVSKVAVDGIGRDPCPCDASGINSLDRDTAGRRDDGAHRASNVANAVTLGVPLGLVLLEARSRERRPAYVGDAVVLFESLALVEGIDAAVKVAARRPRPLLYGLTPGDPELARADNYRSFFSAHTASAFAVGMAYARTYSLRHPESRSRWMVYAAAAVGGAAVGTLRVAAGDHFPTDVLAGAVAGTTVGLAVPAFHRTRGSARVSVVPTRAGATACVALALP